LKVIHGIQYHMTPNFYDSILWLIINLCELFLKISELMCCILLKENLQMFFTLPTINTQYSQVCVRFMRENMTNGTVCEFIQVKQDVLMVYVM